MRPILRGEKLLDSAGNPKAFTDYKHARGDLIDRLGEYCSYCEMPLHASLAVEHIKPKDLYPALKLEWDNFLLACTNCNSTKGTKDVILDDYYWSHIDNTFRAFIYSEGGLVKPNPLLTDEEKIKAQATLELVGLQKRSVHDGERSDRRQSNRREIWDIAKRALSNLQANNIIAMRDQIVNTALGYGFWSVWMTVFKDDPDMLQRFIDGFAGTCRDCFDADGKPIPRLGGNL